MVDVATGWTECLPLVTRDGALVVEAIKRAPSLFPWLLRGVDFDDDSAFMNNLVVPWCRKQQLEVTRSRAHEKNDQAFVGQKNRDADSQAVQARPAPILDGQAVVVDHQPDALGLVGLLPMPGM